MGQAKQKFLGANWLNCFHRIAECIRTAFHRPVFTRSAWNECLF